MSLINEALRKARLEAARQESARRGIRYPSMEEPGRRSPLLTVLGVTLVLALAGGLFYWLWPGSAPDRQTAAVAVADPAPGAGSGAAPAVDRLVAEPPVGDRAAATAVSPPPPRSPAPTRERRQPNASSPPPPPSVPEADPPPTAQAPPAAPAPATPVRRQSATSGESPPAAAGPLETAASGPDPATPTPPTEPAPAAAIDPPPTGAAATPAEAPANAEIFLREATIPGAGTFRLGGIAWSERQPFALINGKVVGPGDRVQGLLVSSVERAQVVLRADQGDTYILRIR